MGLAQVRGQRGEILCAEDPGRRVDCDLEYIRMVSVGLDLGIMIRTAFAAVRCSAH
jgi:lipopolysaccharide/colanic/teichoic acid biosynthesis glycosyltransferase